MVAAAVPEAFGGAYPIDNFVRLLIVMLAIPIALVCVKFAWNAWRLGDYQRMWGILSYGLMGAAPASGSIFRFGYPLPVQFAVLYLAGLICAVIALGYHVTINPPWRRWRRRTPRRR